MTQPHTEGAVRHPRPQTPPRGPLLALFLLVLLAGGLAAYYVAGRPTLVFTNRLAAPVRVAVDSGNSLVVQPGKSGQLPMPGKLRVAMWEVIPPLSADGRPMGEEVRGSVVVPGARGRVYRSALPRGPHGDYFAPLITNATDDLLRVKVNAGLEGAVDCGCAVRPGARRVFIGYYRLYRNSSVQARTGDGRAATFRDLGPNVATTHGAIGLRFDSRDFKP